MNELVKTMWEESTGSVWPPPGKFTAGEYDYNLEKFAELIVRKCATLAFDGPNGILEHFGVEDKQIKVGGRIKVVSAFNVGARGTVTYIEPTGKLWVRRDGASSDVSYYPEEVIGDD